MSLSPLRAALETPTAPAWVLGDGVVSFAELGARVMRAMGWLEEHGVPAAHATDAPVAVVGRSDRATLGVLYALIEAAIPALMIHPRLTPAERRELVDRARPLVVFDSIRDGDPAAASLPGRPRSVEPCHDERPPAERPLAIVYTSGTTDHPKGVVLGRRAFAASAAASARNLGWRDDDRWLLTLPIAHIGGLSILTRCLIARRPVVLPAELEQNGRLAPTEWLESVERDRVTIASLVPAQLDALLERAPQVDPPPHLRAILLGGAAASPRLLERAAGRGWPVLTTYGLTEACSQVATQPPGTTNRGALGSGRPLPGVELATDADGVLRVRGPMLLSGYWSPEGIEPALDAKGWLRTSDLAEIDRAGNLHVLGRASERIITGGENVSPAEVERVLESLPGIERACVFGQPDPRWGQVVCAALVATSGVPPPHLATQVRERLAPHKRPRFVAWVPSLAVTPGQKLDRKETARRARSRLVPVDD